MENYDLLGKTELSITGIILENANLMRIADTVAGVLRLQREDLLVTDVRGENLVLDILKRGLDAKDIAGKERPLLESLASLPGVRLRQGARIDSRGLLSWVSLDPVSARETLAVSEQMADRLRERLEKSVVVFPTGTELANGQVMDTNSPAIRDRLVNEGYWVSFGQPLKDDEDFIAAGLRERAEEGYGLIVTTGGVGAEDKDKTVEAVLLLDPDAITPAIAKYELGVGRHRHKDSVRIAVGRYLDCLIVALPGPTDEVLLGIGALVEGLAARVVSKAALADRIAAALRKRLLEKAHAGSHDGRG